MPATDDSTDEPTDEQAEDPTDEPTDDATDDLSGDFTVTPYAVEGDVDYDELLDRFGADRITDEQRARFPEHPLVRREVFYAGRDLDRFLDAATSGDPHSIVTGRGPSGPMHLGHVFPFYFAKRLQAETGATVLIPLSDDEKYLTKDRSLAEIGEATRENLLDLLAVGFDPENTYVVIDTADADVVYPIAATFAKDLTQSTVEATYGDPPNAGVSFYPAVQATHLLLPQLIEGRHPTLVPIAVDQDPHVRVTRDVAAKERYPVDKPGALLSKFLPSLTGPGKMSASGERPSIDLDASREEVFETIRTHAYSGGRTSVAEHRERGGDPEVDVAYQYLYYFFEDDDERVRDLARRYREGDLLSGEMKELAAERIADFLEAHQRRRAALGPLEAELPAYRLTRDERERALRRVGYPEDALAIQQPAP